MKLAIIGSRELTQINVDGYVPEGVDEIVSGGAKGVDGLAREFANRKGIKLTEFLPEYNLYGRAAPMKRNQQIAEYADQVLAFWDGKSKGTEYTINLFEKLGKRARVVVIKIEDCP